MSYKIVVEHSAPTFYDIGTGEELYDECQADDQRLWVVSYNDEEKEIIDWLQDFMLHEEDKARDYIKKLNKGE